MNKKNKFIAGICLISIALTISCTQPTYRVYISPEGKDADPGTWKKPKESLKAAIDYIREIGKGKQAEIVIGEGEYFMQEPLVLGPEITGTEGSSLVIKAEKGTSPVIYGGKKLEPFEKVSENLWRVKVPEVTRYNWQFEQLFVNGKRAVRAKTPNTGFFFLKNVLETVLVKGTGRAPEFASQKIKLFGDGANIISSFSKKDIDDALVTFYHKWNTTRKPIIYIEKDSSAIFTVGKGMAPWNKLDEKTRYTIENYKAALDTCGEWFLENTGYLYYIPRPG